MNIMMRVRIETTCSFIRTLNVRLLLYADRQSEAAPAHQYMTAVTSVGCKLRRKINYWQIAWVSSRGVTQGRALEGRERRVSLRRTPMGQTLNINCLCHNEAMGRWAVCEVRLNFGAEGRRKLPPFRGSWPVLTSLYGT